MKYPQKNSFSRFVPILLVIVITIVAVAAVLAIGQALFGGDNNQNQDQEQAETVDIGNESLLSSESGRSIRLTVRGPIVADESHRSYQVTISPSSRVMATYEGYLESEMDIKKYDNNTSAYEELIYALQKRKMMDGIELTDEQNDLRGICATGKIYMFETLMDDETVKTLWTSDCSGSKGSALANVDEIIDMFIKQIPDGDKMASSVGLGMQDSLLFRL